MGAGRVIRCQAPLVSVSALYVVRGLNTHQALDVRRATLSHLLDGKAALTPEMALRIEKAFGPKLDAAAADATRLRHGPAAQP